MPNIGRRAFVAGSAAVLAARSWPASAQAYPVRPITFMIPFPRGGSTTAPAPIRRRAWCIGMADRAPNTRAS